MVLAQPSILAYATSCDALLKIAFAMFFCESNTHSVDARVLRSCFNIENMLCEPILFEIKGRAITLLLIDPRK